MSMPYLPHTPLEIERMLETIGASSLEELFADIPDAIRLGAPLELPPGLSEYEVATTLAALAARNEVNRVSFLGCGCYDHLIPAAVGHIISRTEFYTAYTPYQAEVSQGILQAMFEFQTMMCQLTGHDVSNASLYDGATAAAEACALALAAKRRAGSLLYSETLHPHTKQVLRTYFAGRGLRLVEVKADGYVTSREALAAAMVDDVAAVVVQSPNVYGIIESFQGFAQLAHEHSALFVISANPMALSCVTPPARWGADVAVGDTQVLGFPPSFGGPTAGYITASSEQLRRMPGRIVGQTVDREGRRAYVLTLQAREQHIKRERATSNICTNEALVALGNAVYLAALGEQGFREVGRLNVAKSHYLYDRLVGELPVRPVSDGPFFNEFTVRLPCPCAEVLPAMEESGYRAGVALHTIIPDADERLVTIAVTEKRTRAEIDGYVAALTRILA